MPISLLEKPAWMSGALADGEHPAEHAVDEDPTTWAQTARASNPWLAVDLGRRVNVSSVSLTLRRDDAFRAKQAHDVGVFVGNTPPSADFADRNPTALFMLAQVGFRV